MLPKHLTLPVGPILHTFMQNSITFCSQLEEAIDVIAEVAVEKAGLDVHVKFGDSRSNYSEL